MSDSPIKSRATFDRQLAILRDDTVRMSQMVDTSIEQAIQALKNQDVALAQQVVANDDRINAQRYDIENLCFLLLATQQPTARDLRSVVTAIHIVVELERIGDHAQGIALNAIDLAQEPLLKPLIDIPRMAEIARGMMHDSINAYLDWDVEKAQHVMERDQQINHLNEQIYRELLTYMLQDPRNINRATLLLWVSHKLERIGDRITNICERVIFMVTGEMGKTEEGQT
jgi:phosphate transport system protein